MTAGVRQQLTEALDAAEKIAKAATPGPWEVDDTSYAEVVYADDRQTAVVAGGRWGGEASVFHSTDDAIHIARWDPATVLRLVERDRALLATNASAQASLDEKVRAFDSRKSGELIAATARCKAITEQLTAAAAFWLGTPEVDHG